MPELEAVYQQYQDQGVVVLGVNVTEGAAEISQYAQSAGLTFPMVRDTSLSAARAYRVNSLPTTLFFDRQGQLHRWSDSEGRQLDRGVGARDRAFFSEHIEALLR
jgi:peroxiredoxin